MIIPESEAPVTVREDTVRLFTDTSFAASLDQGSEESDAKTAGVSHLLGAPNGASESWAMPDDGRKLVVEAVLLLPEVTGRRAPSERARAEVAGERLA